MNKNLAKIEKLIGKEQLDRTLEVLNILGVTLPDEYEIEEAETSRIITPNWNKVLGNELSSQKRHRIKFLNNDIMIEPQKGIIPGKIQCNINMDNNTFTWEKYSDFKEGICIKTNSEEGDLVDNYYLTIVFMLLDGLRTSMTCIFNQGKCGHQINNTITSQIKHVVHKHEKIEEESSIEEYHNIIKEVLTSEKAKRELESYIDETTIDKILEIFEKPVNNLLTFLKSEDQSWRRRKEINRLKEERIKSLSDAHQKYENAIANADSEYEKGIKKLKREL